MSGKNEEIVEESLGVRGEALEIYVLEDEPYERDSLIAKIDGHKELHLAGAADNAEDALRDIAACIPDGIILDLELHMGGGDGLDFLKGMINLNLSRKPYVVVATNNISPVTHNAARRLGADFIVTKNQQGYSEETPVKLLLAARSSILASRTSSPKAGYGVQDERGANRIRRLIGQEFDKLGVSPKSVGYRYLTEAIILVINGRTKQISREVGKLFKKADNSVDRAMQNAINRTWNQGNPEELYKNYTAKINLERGVPTVMEFVFYYAQKIKTML